MRQFSESAFVYTDYSNPVANHTRIDTTGFGRASQKGIYQNMTINFATYKTGQSEKEGRVIDWEIVNLSLVDAVSKITLDVSFNPSRDFARYCELVYICGLKDENGQPGIKYKQIMSNGNPVNLIEDLLGLSIDVAVDKPVTRDGGYINFRLRAFFKNGFSAREVLKGSQVAADINTVFNTLEDSDTVSFGNNQNQKSWGQQTKKETLQAPSGRQNKQQPGPWNQQQSGWNPDMAKQNSHVISDEEIPF